MKVYVIRNADTPLVKIGISKEPFRRLAMLQVETKDRLILEKEFDAEDARKVERTAHALLQDARAHGEWFRVTVEEAIEAVEVAIPLAAEPEAIKEPRKPREGDSISLRLTPEDHDILERLAFVYGGKTQAVRIALRELERGNADLDAISTDRFIAALEARLVDEVH